MKSTNQVNIQELACCLNKNIRLLRKLLTGPKHKAELATALDVSKSTVYYRFKNLEQYHLVVQGTDGYQITTAGRNVTEMYLGALESIEKLYRIQSLFQEVSHEAIPPRDTLVEANAVFPGGHPEQLWAEFCMWALSAQTIRGILPRTSCSFIEGICNQLEADEMTLEVALAPKAIEYSAEYCTESYRLVLESESSVIFETSSHPPYCLMLTDKPQREVGMLVLTENGSASGFIRFNSERSWQWANKQLAKYTDEKKPEPLTEITPD